MKKHPDTHRRAFLGGLAASFAALSTAAATTRMPLLKAEFRGPIDNGKMRVAGSEDRGTLAFNAMLKSAAAQKKPVFLPPGTYALSNIDLPAGLTLTGIRGLTRILYSGDGRLFTARDANRITLSGLSIDGAKTWLGDGVRGLVEMTNCSDVTIRDCEIYGSAANGLVLERVSGTISDSRLSGAQDAALWAIESEALDIRNNQVSDCGDGGILVHRWTQGNDGTVVANNRIARIGARSGGTGQYGNGINIFRADNVQVTNNHISDCAFTAIRANSASNAQILGNHCRKSGETAIYSEFAFEGAIISDNVIDGAANGIASVNFNDGGRLTVIEGNLIRNMKIDGPYIPDGNYFGIGISAEADTVVANNVIENAPRWGLVLGWGPYLRNVSVTGNVIRNTPVGCAVSTVEGAGKTLIRNNMFSDISEVAVAGFHWAERVTGELATDSAAPPDHLDIGGNALS